MISVTKTKIKICGIGNIEAALTAVKFGADALGFVFAPSPRKVTLKKAQNIITQLPPFVTTVGVFKDQPLEYVNNVINSTGVDLIQLHGNESREYCFRITKRIIKSILVDSNISAREINSCMNEYRLMSYILDSGAGCGQTFRWDILSKIINPVIVAGGLTPDNVGILIRKYNPYAVDVSSGVEISPGIKDLEKIKRFILEVRNC